MNNSYIRFGLAGRKCGLARGLAWRCLGSAFRLPILLFALLLSGVGLADTPPTAGSPVAAPATAMPSAPAAPTAPADVAPAAVSGAPQGLDHDVQDLKQQVLDLNRDLFVLQEDLLFPANTQVAVFVSIDVGTFFNLDSVKLTIDGQQVSGYLYSKREAEALLQGGVQRLYVGNLKVGQHEIVAVFTGKGPHERDYRRGTTLKLDKGLAAKFVELKISDLQRRQEPEFITKVWE